MISKKNQWLFILTWMAATTFFVACDQGPSGLGADVLPEDDLIQVSFSDTTLIDLQTQVIDSINTYQAANQLIGNYVDPLFGTIHARTFTQVFPRSGLNFGKADELIFDSLVLKLTFSASYGRLDQAQTLRVYELTEEFPDTSLIYSSRQLAFDPQDLCDGRQISFSGVVGGQVLRTRLSDELGEKILFGDSAILSDRNQFLSQVLKGLVIETDPVSFVNREPGAVFSLFGNDSDSLLVLHYRKFDSTTQTYQPFREPFLITNSTPRYHALTRSNTQGTLFETATVSDTVTSVEFVQSGLLMKAWVRFPELDVSDPRLVSRAELILPIDPSTLGSDDRYFPPIQIIALRADETGTEIIENNFGQSVASTSSALTYNSDRQAYIIPITGYLQRLYNGTIENDNGFVIIPSSARSSIERVVLAGTGHPNPDLRPRLELTLSTVPR